jgi:hypothetical protein
MQSRFDLKTENNKQGWMANDAVRKVRIFGNLVIADTQSRKRLTPRIYWAGHSRHRGRPRGCVLAGVCVNNTKLPMTVMSAMTKPYFKPIEVKK